MSLKLDLQSLSTQIIISLIVAVIMTAIAIGLPILLLLRNQLEQQAWSQVEQGLRATQALYQAKRIELSDFATLTAQRPTLGELIQGQDQQSLNQYLSVLQSGAGLDIIAVCDNNADLIAASVSTLPDDLCRTALTEGVFQNLVSDRGVWMIANQPILDGNQEGDRVIVGISLDDEFVLQISEQTALEQSIWRDDGLIASSMTGMDAADGAFELSDPGSRRTFENNNQPYYATSFLLDNTNILAEVALNTFEIATTQKQLIWTSLISIITVTLVVSIFGILVGRRISHPLEQLSFAADRLRRGDLDSAIRQNVRVREVARVASALESARIDLLSTLRNLEQEKDWVDQLLESIIEGIVTLDQKGNIDYFSSGAEKITGWEREDVIGRPFDQIFRFPETGEPIAGAMPAPGSRRKLIVELSDGRSATLAFTRARLTPAGAEDYQRAFVFRDISEEEIIHRILGQFLANIAHEFRTPLSALAASIELLIDQASDLSEQELEELLISLHLGMLSLQTLVDNLLEGASIEAGRFQVIPRPADLGKIISEASQTMQPLLKKYDQHLVVELPAAVPVVMADSRRIVQVLINLLANASKYGAPETDVKISAIPLHEQVRVEVSDRGPGIPLDRKDRVFQRFMTDISNDSGALSGLGLGLSIVKTVIDAHGGQVGVENRPEGGSIFWFTLPVVEQV